MRALRIACVVTCMVMLLSLLFIGLLFIFPEFRFKFSPSERFVLQVQRYSMNNWGSFDLRIRKNARYYIQWADVHRADLNEKDRFISCFILSNNSRANNLDKLLMFAEDSSERIRSQAMTGIILSQERGVLIGTTQMDKKVVDFVARRYGLFSSAEKRIVFQCLLLAYKPKSADFFVEVAVLFVARFVSEPVILFREFQENYNGYRGVSFLTQCVGVTAGILFSTNNFNSALIE